MVMLGTDMKVAETPKEGLKDYNKTDLYSEWLQKEGVKVYQDFYFPSLAKIELGHAQDMNDVAEMLARGLVMPDRLREDFAAIEPLFYRYPALDPAAFRRALETALSERS